MDKFRIVIADDHPLIRIGLKDMIQKDPELVVVGEAQNGEELLKILAQSPCDLVVTDISMPKLDGVAVIDRIRHDFPEMKILVLSMLKDYAHFQGVMSRGASGYIVKDDAPDQLIPGIKQVLRGRKYISPSATTLLVERELHSLDQGEMPSLEVLTLREKEILGLIAQGLPNKQIAARLKISVRTAEHHRAHLTDKLGFKDTASLVKYAISKGLI